MLLGILCWDNCLRFARPAEAGLKLRQVEQVMIRKNGCNGFGNGCRNVRRNHSKKITMQINKIIEHFCFCFQGEFSNH